MGLVELEQPGGCRPPQVGIVEGVETGQIEDQVGTRGRSAGERSEGADALFAIVVGGVDGGQVADQQGDQPEPDDRLHEGDPGPEAAVRRREPEGGDRGAADLERPLPRAGLRAPEDEGEADDDRHHPHQRQAHQRHRRVQAAEVGRSGPVAAVVDQDAVGDGERRPGDPGERIAGEDDRLDGGDQHTEHQEYAEGE